MFDVLVYVYEHYWRGEACPELPLLGRKLSAAGFDADEIEQALSAIAQKPAKISFTPILAPMPRGILSTITAKLNQPLTTQQAHALFAQHYASEFFVDVLASVLSKKLIVVFFR